MPDLRRYVAESVLHLPRIPQQKSSDLGEYHDPTRPGRVPTVPTCGYLLIIVSAHTGLGFLQITQKRLRNFVGCKFVVLTSVHTEKQNFVQIGSRDAQILMGECDPTPSENSLLFREYGCRLKTKASINCL